MIPVIGVMIGMYCTARLMEMLGGRGPVTKLVMVSALLTELVGIAALLASGFAPGSHGMTP